MGNHYYLVASLPSIAPGETPAVTREDFLRRAEELMPTRERETLGLLMEGRAAGSPDAFAREWAAFETALRNACARLRATRLGVEIQPHLREAPGETALHAPSVAAAFQAPTPTERERALDALRWAELERLAGHDPFTTPAVFAYGLRLHLAWRWASLDPKQGRATAARIAGMAPPQTPESD